MGQGAIDYIGVKGGLNINGLIKDYYVYAGEKVSAGDFVEFINGFSGNLMTAQSNSVVVDTVKNSGDVIFAVPLDNNRVFIAYRHYATGDASVCGVVCTIENGKILVGTVTKLHDSVTTVYISALNIAKDKVFVSYGAGSNDYLYGVVCNINGTVITHGANTQISTISSSGRNNISTMLLDSGKIFIVYERILGIVCTINNTTITFGTETTISSQNTSRISAVGLGNNRAFVAHSASSSVMGAVCTITNTTIVVNVDTSLISGTNSGNRINTLQIDDNRVVILHSYDSSYFLYGMVCKVVDNTITTGTDTAISLINSSVYVEPSACLLEDGIFVGFGGGSAIHGVVCSINELEMVAGEVKTLSSDVASIVYTTSVTLPYNNVFMAHVYGSNYYLYAQIFGTSNKTPSNNVTVPVFETQVRKATTSDIYGVAKTNGMGAYKVVEYTIPEGESVSEGENRKYTIETTVDGDIIPKTWTAINDRYKYKSDDGIIIDLSSDATFKSDGQNVIDACDGNETSYFQAKNAVPMNITFDFPEAIKILKLRIKYASSNPSLTIYGSNDGGETLEKLFEKAKTTGTTTSTVTVAFEKPDYYKQYIVSLDIGGYAVYNKVYEIQVLKYMTANSFSGTALQSGMAGDTIQIAVPVSDEESTGHNDKVSVYVPDVPKFVDFINSVVPIVWIDGDDYMTATATNDYGEWNIEATNIYIDEGVVGNPPNRAFDDKDSSAYMTGNWGDITDKVYLYLNCPEGVSLKPSVVTITHGNCGNTSYNLSKVQAYDGSEWVELATLTSSASTQKTDTFNLSKKEYYTAFRIEITPGVQGNRSLVYDFKITSGTLKVKNWR